MLDCETLQRHDCNMVSYFKSKKHRGDGTNTAAGSDKAHTVEVRSLFQHLPVDERGFEETPEMPDASVHVRWADLMKIPEHCGGAEMRAMYLKQCRGLGLRDWVNEDSFLVQPRLSHEQAPDHLLDTIHVRFFIFGSDDKDNNSNGNGNGNDNSNDMDNNSKGNDKDNAQRQRQRQRQQRRQGQ